MRGSLKDYIGRFVGYAFFLTFFLGFCLALSFYAIGTPTSDPGTGRIFPVPMHGTRYVRSDQGEWFYGLMGAATFFLIVWILLGKGESLVAVFRKRK